jgi:hemolysin-activating ACP:hemolysin acyltransferase
VVALGFATKYLFTKPPFANLSFAECTNALLGKIERGHYWFVVDSSNDIQGFLGWELTTEEKAESWLQGGLAPFGEENKVGDCIVLSAYAANSSRVHRYLWDRMREIMKGKRILYFKRQYKNGRLRPGRLIINAFVSNHIERNASASVPVQE